MFKRIVELIKQALRKMVQIQNLEETIKDKEIYTISNKMIDSLELWEQIYKDNSPWLSEPKGIYSLGIAPLICSSIATHVLNEFKSTVLVPGEDIKEVDESVGAELDTRASYINEVYHRNLLSTLSNNLEHALAVGGMIVKPYIVNNEVYYNYCMQGEFVPLSFTDDGLINDIAFYDDFIVSDKRYRRVERHVFDQSSKTITVINTAYMVKIEDVTEKGIELGTPVPLQNIDRWKDIQEEVVIQNVDKPLYGHFKVAKANNIENSSPLGISLFHRAVNTIKRADIQYSRLDWEYEGGQMAVDVDTTATFDHGHGPEVAQLRDRLYRKIDVGGDDTYNVFAPTLRDTQYKSGLNYYLMHIEDLCEISRGTISEVQSEARTATELRILQERSYNTIARNQKALEKCLDDVIYATNVLVELYNLAPSGEYVTTHEWSDSILNDTESELNQKLQLLDKNVLSKAEVRAWYNGEDLETAQAQIDKIIEDNQSHMLNDLFSTDSQDTTLEGKEDNEPDTEDEE